MASTSKFFFANKVLHKMTRVGAEERVKLWRHDGVLAEWQTLDSEFLRDVFVRGTDIDLTFCALIEYYATYPRKNIAELPSESRECDICKETLSDTDHPAPSERAMVLPCGHILGERCFALWIWSFKGMSHTCPMCRSEFWFLLDRPSPHERGYDSSNLLKIDQDTRVNAQADDAHGRMVQLWDRILEWLKEIQALTGQLQMWIDAQPEEERDRLIEHIADILIHRFRPPKPDEDGNTELLDGNDETIVSVNVINHIPWVDGGHPQQVIDSRRTYARELEERPAVLDLPAPQSNRNEYVDNLVARQEEFNAVGQDLVENVRALRQSTSLNAQEGRESSAQLDTQNVMTQSQALLRRLDRLPIILQHLEASQQNANLIADELQRQLVEGEQLQENRERS